MGGPSTAAHVVTFNWLIGARPGYQGLLLSDKPQGHGGERETAHMLATLPHLVRMAEARPYTAISCPGWAV